IAAASRTILRCDSLAGRKLRGLHQGRWRFMRRKTEVETRSRKVLRALARWTPALLLIAATAGLYASGLATDISLDNLQAHEIRLRAEVAASPLLALAIFTALYAVATAAFVPVGLVLML